MAWDTATGEGVWDQAVHTAPVVDVCVSPCDNYVFTAGLDGMVLQWEVATGKGVRRFSDQSEACLGVAVNSHTTFLYVACGRVIQTWDLASGELKGTIPAHQHDITGLALSKDGIHALSATSHGTIKVWNLETGQCIRSIQGYAPIALSLEGEYAISAGTQGDFTFWNLFLEAQGYTVSPMICR